METDAYFEDGYYDSPNALAKKLNGDKPGRVKFSYEPVTQKFVANVKSETTFTLYGDLPEISGSASGRATAAVPVSRRRLVRCLYEATQSSI